MTPVVARTTTFNAVTALAAARRAKTIVETGTLRRGTLMPDRPSNDTLQFEGDGCATLALGEYARAAGGKVWSVDCDPAAIAFARQHVNGLPVELVLTDSVVFLRAFDRPIDVLYLDSLDLDPANPTPAQRHALTEIEAVYPRLHAESIVAVDDYCGGNGKAALVEPFLVRQGWSVVMRGTGIVFARAVVASLDILFRSCSRVTALHGESRIVDAPKSAILLACLRSLLRACDALALERPELAMSVRVVDDHSDSDLFAAVRPLVAAVVPVEGVGGNGASLSTTFALARASTADLVYIVEDDYVHAPSALAEMVADYGTLRERVGGEVILHPYDCPDRYAEPYESMILLGQARHWRTVRHTTGTFLAAPATIRQFWPFYASFARYGEPGVTEDTTLNLIYQCVPAFSPLPGLAVHLQGAAQLSPFVNWHSWWAG